MRIVPVASALTSAVIVIATVPPIGIVPRAQSIVAPENKQRPWAGTASMKIKYTKEFEARRRFESDTLWATLSLTF